ncbi:multi-copper polyphenol oxidoreductase, laccase [Thioploca ingrica]|uniref:Purine nucleoside phosphorylase n=1 Tax=Thioploca ingrica TaxID=40754 RepID=A0A090AFC5_9GAMM|nr:multi-copper polyphenol oxidoreductase, laccase [Thioploca ingrica]
MLDVITPNWPAPPQVKAYITTRHGGVSHPPYDSFNLAEHVGDDAQAVANNRAILVQTLKLPTEPIWLNQVHGTQAIAAQPAQLNGIADATYTNQAGQICVVLTADCLPVLFCDRYGTTVAAAHAGWRGLAAGILEATLQHFQVPAQDILVWLGPAIGPRVFEVGDEVRTAFIQVLPSAQSAFTPSRPGHWLANLYQLAQQRLSQQGVTHIYGGDFCTYTDQERFYSYRRDKVTGRMASLIWLHESNESI